MATSEFTKSLFALLEQKFVSLGFRKRKYGILTISVSEDVIGLVGLNTGRRPGSLEINPVIGVRNQRVERLVAELLEEPFNEVSPFAASANVGYLSPSSSYKPFIFGKTSISSAERLADELIAAVRDYGLAFMHANESLESLLITMRSTRFGNQSIAAYRIPVALHLLRKDEGSDHIPP